MPADHPYVPTSIAEHIASRLAITHKRRGIAIFSGPPGIGKTTAIEAFERSHPGSVVILKVNNPRASIRVAMQHAIVGLRRVTRNQDNYVHLDPYRLKQDLETELKKWQRDFWQLPDSPSGVDDCSLTFVFDEAQNLNQKAIEALRYWNDPDRCYGPFPIGLAFIGNNEFSLKSDRDGVSVISAAVADRALFTEPFEYADLSNADIKLFLRSRGIEDDAALAAIVKHYNAPRTPRSLRSVGRLAADLADEAGGAPITLAVVRSVLNP